MTVDLPDGLHSRISALAYDAPTSFDDTVARLLRAALDARTPITLSISPITGLTVFSSGRTVTDQDVRALEDEGSRG